VRPPIGAHDKVVFTQDVPDDGVVAGDVGVVLLEHEGHDLVPTGLAIEVTTPLGETIAVADVSADRVRPAYERDNRYARST
jgi:hypothetical protein